MFFFLLLASRYSDCLANNVCNGTRCVPLLLLLLLEVPLEPFLILGIELEEDKEDRLFALPGFEPGVVISRFNKVLLGDNQPSLLPSFCAKRQG